MKMRILIIHNILWAHYKSLLFSELTRLSSAHNAQIHVAQIAVSEHSRPNVDDTQLAQYKYSYTLLFDESLENVRLWPKIKALFKEFNNYKPDVLNITGYYDPAQLLLLFWAKIRGVKVVISTESNARHNPRQWAKELFKKMILGLTDGFICFGKSSADYLLDLGVSPQQILTNKAAVVDNERLAQKYAKATLGREQQKTKLNLPQYNFIYAGRLIELKNLVLLLKCFNKINSPNWGLILLGDGDQKPDLETLIEENAIQNVTFLKGVNWYEVTEYMALADVFILPSTSEAWGLVVNEAMVCGLPVIVSDCCGCVEDLVQDNENGFAFNPYNEQELTAKLLYFVQNPDKLKPMGDVSRQVIKSFSAEKAATDILTGLGRLSRS